MAKAAKKAVKKTRAKPAVRSKPIGGGNPNPDRRAIVKTQFQPGNGGRQKGVKNKFGVKLKEAILEAAEKSGRDGRGKDGAVGYLVWLSRAEPAVFGRMLEKVMPLQVEVKDKTENRMDAATAVAKLRERGIPVPPALLSLAEGVAKAVHERQEQDYDAELNGEGFEGADTLPALQPEGDADNDEEEYEDDDTEA